MLWGIVFSQGEFKVADWVKWVFGGLAFLAVLISVLIITGAWDYFKDYFSGGGNSELFTNIVFVVLVGIAVAVVIGFGGKGKD